MNTQPLTANEAAEIAKGHGKESLPEIYGKIRAAAASGNMEIFHYKEIGAGARAELENAGFHVSQEYDQRERGWLVSIKWGSRP